MDLRLVLEVAAVIMSLSHYQDLDARQLVRVYSHHSTTLSHSPALLNYHCFNSPHLPISLPHTHLCTFGHPAQLGQDEESTVCSHHLCFPLTFIVFFTLPPLCWTCQQHDPWLAMVCWSGAEAHQEPGSWGGGGQLWSLRLTMARKQGKTRKGAENSAMLNFGWKGRDGRERQVEMEAVCVVCFSLNQDCQNCCR